MCGIAGLYRPQRPFDNAETTQLVRLMTDRLIHRGPDAEGHWSDPEGRCILGHRRLSIIDVSDAGRQPFASSDGRWVITFNGEIYNFQELRPAIERQGGQIRGRTDTEVLVESVALWGIDALHRLDGMFAFAAYDRLTGDLILARDAFGEKPLYFMELATGGLAFASELQALECLPEFDPTIDHSAIAELLCFQYIGAPRSIYRKVEKLRPGHWIRLTATGGRSTGRFYEFQPTGTDKRRLPDMVDELEGVLVRSLRRRLIADVPLGVFLSGGVDSSTACALMTRKLGVATATYSVGFKNEPGSEHLTARAFARHLGTDHHEMIIEPQDAAQFFKDIGRVLDEPNADTSCLPTYYLSALAHKQIKVAIGGDGGDEMFGGYNRYLATLTEFTDHRDGRKPAWRAGAAAYGPRLMVAQERHIEGLFGFVPPAFREQLERLRADVDQAGSCLLAGMRRTDVENYLPGAVLGKVDRMSMQHSLEVRTPYLNIDVARFAERLPDTALVSGGQGKRILRELARRYLPPDLVNLPKQGFGLPMSHWAAKNLIAVARPLLLAHDGRLMTMFGHAAIERFIAGDIDGISLPRIWTIATLESWLRHHPAALERQQAARPTENITQKPGGNPVWIEAHAPGLEEASAYADTLGITQFAIDGPQAGEYRVERGPSGSTFRSTTGAVSVIVLPNGRTRIELPFRPLGHFMCTDRRSLSGIFWCVYLIRAGYLFAHIPSMRQPRRVFLIGQLVRNLLSRLGVRDASAD
jgi:asparagine synthase (glutamine-hydrolysing)